MNIRKIKRGAFLELECKHFVAEGLGLSYFTDETLKEKFKPHVFFIWGVLPGEKFIAHIRQVKSKLAYGILADRDAVGLEHSEKKFLHKRWALLSLSAERAEPACENYLRCGGCRMQHLSYLDTLRYKKTWLQAQLERNGVNPTKLEFYDYPENFRWRYRNHVQVHINKWGTYGFYEPVSYHTRAFPEHGCLIFEEKALRSEMPRFPVAVRAARIRVDTDGRAVFTELNSPEEKRTLATYSVEWPVGREVKIEFPVTSFFQANLRALPAWLSKISACFQRTGLSSPRVLELYSGFGFISRMLSLEFPLSVLALDILKKEQVEAVRFFENGKEIPSDFSNNFRTTDLFLPQKISETLLEEIRKFSPELLLVNPPRAGLSKETWKVFREVALKAFQGPIIYSSCDAATMARDLALFQSEGYTCHEMCAFDFFPWTHHFETVSYLTHSKNP